MAKRVLITGGAGFIGSHLADELIANGYEVCVLDNLSPQVHGSGKEKPPYLHRDVDFIYGDVCDANTVRKALRGVKFVYHFAAAVGVGQSMYEIQKYTSINNLGTAVLLEQMVESNIERLVVASSMSVYGEGLYCRKNNGKIVAAERDLVNLKSGEWELFDEEGELLEPIPTPETKSPSLASVYALSKYDQERLCLMVGKAYNIPVAALRFFNVYGTRQSLSNPYTGVLAIFASRYLNGNAPLIFEDGNQKRDFVSVYDVCRGCRLALETELAAGKVFNIGSGVAYTVSEIAHRMANALGKEKIEPIITKKYRVGDIRHCFSDISQAQEVLGYKPKVNLDDGLVEFADWLCDQIADDQSESANAELVVRGLTV
jgi:dTDP-L-rhamnose 4-epimerase